MLILPFHSPGGATKLSLFCVVFKKSLLFKNVPTQSPIFFLGVPIVRQLLPTPKPVCYISINTYSAIVSVGFVQFHRFLWEFKLCSLSHAFFVGCADNLRNRRSIRVDSWYWFELKVVFTFEIRIQRHFSACICHFVDWLIDCGFFPVTYISI